jgi:hypothetical protein
MSFSIYITLGLISVYMFGSIIDESVLDNIDSETNFSSYVIRVSFLLVLACHIPYIYFSGKESVCIIVDEIQRQSMTKALESTLQRSLIVETEERLTEGDPDEVSLMAYKSMNKVTYLVITVCLYGVEILLSTFIPDIGIVFNFVSAFAVSSLAFIFPGMFYLKCEKKF